MAYVQGYPGSNVKAHSLKRMALLLSLLSVTVVVLLISSRDWRSEASVIIPTTVVVGFFIVVSSLKITPMAWKKIFRKTEYEHLLAANQRIAAVLAALDDRYFVFHEVQFEFFHCNHLVIGPGGLFVIRRALLGSEVVRKDGRFFPAADEPATAARKLWQVCHFLSMVIRKGYKTEYLPQPLFVCPDVVDAAEGKVGDVPVVALGDLPDRIAAAQAPLPEHLPQSFAVYLNDRYASR